MTLDFRIRNYCPASDQADLLRCIAQLQDYERELDPDLKPGEIMAADYLALLEQSCVTCQGQILVACGDDEALLRETVVGFVCVLRRVQPIQPDEPVGEYGYITDLVVCKPHRGQGLGIRLMQAAADLARQQEVTVLRVGVLAQNAIARHLYGSLGYSEYHVQLSKRLR